MIELYQKLENRLRRRVAFAERGMPWSESEAACVLSAASDLQEALDDAGLVYVWNKFSLTDDVELNKLIYKINRHLMGASD